MFESFYFVFQQRPLQAWSQFNAAATKCRLLISYIPLNASAEDTECIRRLFWSCYILERSSNNPSEPSMMVQDLLRLLMLTVTILPSSLPSHKAASLTLNHRFRFLVITILMILSLIKNYHPSISLLAYLYAVYLTASTTSSMQKTLVPDLMTLVFHRWSPSSIIGSSSGGSCCLQSSSFRLICSRQGINMRPTFDKDI